MEVLEFANIKVRKTRKPMAATGTIVCAAKYKNIYLWEKERLYKKKILRHRHCSDEPEFVLF